MVAYVKASVSVTSSLGKYKPISVIKMIIRAELRCLSLSIVCSLEVSPVPVQAKLSHLFIIYDLNVLGARLHLLGKLGDIEMRQTKLGCDLICCQLPPS